VRSHAPEPRPGPGRGSDSGSSALHETSADRGRVVLGIPWNFTRFLVDADGRVVRRYAPTVTPEAIEGDIAALRPR
jgi:glutathione peroxidase